MPSDRVGVQGLQTDAEINKLRTALGDVWGIQSVQVNPARGEVTYAFDERAGSLEDFRAAIVNAGFAIVGGDQDGTSV
jgi:copper chaperone CopZ